MEVLGPFLEDWVTGAECSASGSMFKLTGELVCREISNCRAHLRVHRLVPYRGTESLPTSWECAVGVGHAGDRFPQTGAGSL